MFYERMNSVYLDNCATTMMPREVIKEMIRWCNQGNPSASYPSAIAATRMMNDFRALISPSSSHKVIFTSGASESNSTAVQCITNAYNNITGIIPHVIVSAVEHKSILETVENLNRHGKITLTIVRPASSGHITVESIDDAIRSNTALVCVMSANNETGAINDIASIRKIVNNAGAVFHCDIVQSVGKFPSHEYDSASISFHKLHGPPGIGALIMKQELINGWKICPLIFGSQNSGQRGGTENLPGIGAAFAGMKYTMLNRNKKNSAQLALKKYILTRLGEKFRIVAYEDGVNAFTSPFIVIFGDCSTRYLPGVILMSLIANDVCNAKMKSALFRRGIIVSIGSACNTKSTSASHVLTALGADSLLRKGTLRISLGDESTIGDAKKFVTAFFDMIAQGEHIDLH